VFTCPANHNIGTAGSEDGRHRSIPLLAHPSASQSGDDPLTASRVEPRRASALRVHLVNPSDVSFGVAVITPRWLYVIAAATPPVYGTPVLVDETLAAFDPASLRPGDVVGISIHTANAHRGYAIGREARLRSATVVFGGIHATLYPAEAREHGGAHAVVRGDGDAVWATVLADCAAGPPAEGLHAASPDGC